MKVFRTFEDSCEEALELKHKTPRDVFHFTVNEDFEIFSSQFGILFKEVDEYENTQKKDTNSMK